MKTFLWITLASMLAAQVYPGKADDALKKEQEHLQGTWQATAVVDGGTPEYGDRVETLKLKIKGDHYTYDFGDHEFSATFTVDPTKDPKEMDVTFWAGPMSGKTMRAIYSLQGEELKICTAQYERPTTFVSTLEAQSILFTYHKDLPSKDISGAEIIGYGLYKGSTIMPVPSTSPTTSPVRIETAQLIEQTQQIPATLNVEFGMQFVVHGTPKGKKVKLREVILSPPVTDAKTGKTSTQDEIPFEVSLDDSKDVGAYLTLDSPSDLVPGTWTFQIFDHDKKLLEKSFTLVKP